MIKLGLSLLIIFLSFFVGYGQETTSYNKQISLQHDNDFFTLTDRYYSSGLYLSYKKLLTNPLFKNSKEQIEFKLQQEIYTPSQTESTNINVFDRSYAGFLGLGLHWNRAKDNKLLKVGIVAGLVGPNSGAGGFQRWYHNVLVVSDPPIWVSELNNSFHFNIYSSYTKEWILAPKPFGVNAVLSLNTALGTRDIYLEPELVMAFGRKAQLQNSIYFDQLGTHEREVYFTLNIAYRNVFYNGLIEGNLFGDSSAVLREAQTSLLRFGFDFHNRNGRNNIKFGVRYNTKETPQSRGHKYIILGYGYSFN